MLTPSIAHEIARETSAIIGFNVLITDKNGIVIGSGDVTRLGSFHEASIEVMRTLRPASHGPAEAHRLIGVLPGVTLPILLNNDSVGTVGITGDPGQVERFGRVVRNQTEILLRESLLLRSRMLRESAVEDVLRDLAHYDPEITEPELIAFKARELGYELRLCRCAVVIDVAVEAGAPWSGVGPGPGMGPGAGSGVGSGVGPGLGPGAGSGVGPPESPPPSEPPTLRSAMLRMLRQAFPDPRDLVGTAASGRFVVLHHLRGEDASTDLLGRCREIARDLVRPHSCRIGVGGAAVSVAQLHDSYRDATTALYLANRLGRSDPVTHIADVRTHDLLATVAHGARARFASAMVGPLREQPGWETTRRTITAWCESGFNLVQASAALHIHRNTLVYRLAKIEAALGQSFRDPRTCLAVYLACLIDQLEDSPPT